CSGARLLLRSREGWPSCSPAAPGHTISRLPANADRSWVWLSGMICRKISCAWCSSIRSPFVASLRWNICLFPTEPASQPPENKSRSVSALKLWQLVPPSPMFRVGAEDFLHKHTSSARELSVIRLAMAGAADLVLVRREPEGM